MPPPLSTPNHSRTASGTASTSIRDSGVRTSTDWPSLPW
jgi:hypothetical protein